MAQMRQSSNHATARNNEIFNLHLEYEAGT